MLKGYRESHFISIDGGDWKLVGIRTTTSENKLKNRVVLNKVSFKHAYVYLLDHALYNIWYDYTRFCNKPCIYINYLNTKTVSYTNFNNMSYKIEYQAWR